MGQIVDVFGKQVIFWLALMIIFLVIELLTIGLTSIWFALGAMVAAIAAGCNLNIFIQIALFIIVSIVLLILTKPFFEKYVIKHRVKTNIDSAVGEKIVMEEAINEYEGIGTAKWQGKEWSIKAINPTDTLSTGEIVEIVKVEGVKLIVKKLEGQQ